MAYDDDSVFSGNLYLLDTHNTRQYILTYLNGKPKDFKFAAAHNPKEERLSSEIIYALDGRAEYSTAEDGSEIALTTMFQIKTGEDGKKHLQHQPVEFLLEKEPQANGATLLVSRMTEESIQSLLPRYKSFPTVFRRLINPKRLDSAIQKRENILLPKHPNGADLARAYDEALNARTLFIRPPQKEQSPMKYDYTVAAQKKYTYSDEQIETMLKSFGRDLTQMEREGKLDPVIGREKETEQALKVLTRRKQSSLCFTGDAGVGKSAMFSAIAHEIVSNPNLPQNLKSARVIELDLQAMLAGTKYRGQFEERLKPIVDGLREREGVLKGQKIILAIDEIHSQLGAGGGGSSGNESAGNIMKPFLVAKGISVMGTTTDDEYTNYIEKDGALASRFEKLRLDQPSPEDTLKIAKGLWPLTREHNHLAEDISDENLNYIVTMTTRYAPQEAQPRKTEKVLNMAAASAEFEGRTAVEQKDIISAVAQMSGLPVDFLNQSDHERFLLLKKALPNDVLGQPSLDKVPKALIGARGGLVDENQPWGCFVFRGPTGTGKTEAAKALTRYLFGTEDAMIKLDMSEYSEKHTVSRLIGAPPGYVGFEDSQPALTEQVRRRPYCVLLLDEIEKAHPDVFNVFLSILNDGKMKDNKGKTVLFNNVIIIMTTNMGANEVAARLSGKSGMGFGEKVGQKIIQPEELDKIYDEKMKPENGGVFRPEMVNRINELGGFITFVPLEQSIINALVQKEIEKVAKRLVNPAGGNLPGAKLIVGEEVMAQLAKEGYNPAMGARPMKKAVRERISNPLAEWKMENIDKLKRFIAENGGVVIKIDKIGDEFSPVLEKPAVNDNRKVISKLSGGLKPK